MMWGIVGSIPLNGALTLSYVRGQLHPRLYDLEMRGGENKITSATSWGFGIDRKGVNSEVAMVLCL